MAEDAPAGYYVGRPVAMKHDDQKAPPPPAQAVDGQVNAQVPGYYAGRVRPGGQTPPPAAAADKPSAEPGFFANCFGCFSGGGAAR